jgi:broad specificity phosphatase PhoE
VATHIALIRHGETAWSRDGRHTGRTDLTLTPTGERSARQLRDRLKDVAFDVVLTSPLARAHRTCELAGFGPVAQVDPDLQEWDYGAYEGRTTENIHTENPGWDVLRDGAPGGESIDQLLARLDRVIAKLHGLEGRVAVFSHGHFLRSLAMRWIGQPLINGRHVPLDTAALCRLGYERPDRATPAIELWNAVE